MIPEKSPAMITITQATIDDVDAIAPLFDAYRVFYHQITDLRGSAAFVRARLDAEESVIFLARDRDGNVVCFVQLYPSFSSVRMQRIWILNDLFVTPSARGGGVARHLMERAKQFAVATGAASLMLSTARDNHTAQRLYVSCGYLLETMFLTYCHELTEK
jgi:GNAT superfamily N-acetyltransferase